MSQQEKEEIELKFIAKNYGCEEDSYSKIVMDRKEKFFNQQLEQRKKMLDEKYGARK